MLRVSQFMLDREARTGFFRCVADRLRPGGFLIDADLSSDASPAANKGLCDVWLPVMQAAEITPEAIETMRAAYDRDVAVLPREEIGRIISEGGFGAPLHFLQTGFIRSWDARRA